MYPIWARCLMNLNASKKFVDSIRSDCNPSHGVVWAWTFIQKVVPSSSWVKTELNCLSRISALGAGSL